MNLPFLQKAWELPFVQHASLAAQRFFGRFGIQFAAAITYFSVLSMVPILMVGFAALGLSATLLRPDFAQNVQHWLLVTLDIDGGGVLGDQIVAIIDQAFRSWQAVGLVGIGGAAWAGAKWVMHLQIGVRLQLRPTFQAQPEVAAVDLRDETFGFVHRLARELGILFGLFLLVGLTLLAGSVMSLLRHATSGLLNRIGVPTPELGTSLMGLLHE